MADSPFFILLILSQNPAIHTHIVLSLSLTHSLMVWCHQPFCILKMKLKWNNISERADEALRVEHSHRWIVIGVCWRRKNFFILNRRSACGKRVFRSYVCTLCCYGYVGGYGIQFESRQKAKNCFTRNLFYYIYLLDEEATLCRMCWKHAC